MPRELTEVWRCTNEVHDGVFIDKADADEIEAITGMPATVKRLPLLTPAMAAVIEAAERLDAAWYVASVVDEGHGPSPLERCAAEMQSLSAAVRALTAPTAGGEGG